MTSSKLVSATATALKFVCYFETSGCFLQVTVVNNIPADWPSVSKGITVHWHGFRYAALTCHYTIAADCCSSSGELLQQPMRVLL
jgi:hypothetical protein